MKTCVEFLRELIRTESLPGQEKTIAGVVKSEIEALGFDEVYSDPAGNVIGLVKGRRSKPSVMFNTHLDHVDVGDPSTWPYPPYSAQVQDGRVWGRGAVDIKGPLAAQVYGLGQLVAEGRRPPTDTYLTAVVQEEVGGVGALYLRNTLDIDLVIIGEPSGNHLKRGHRGRFEFHVVFKGTSVHASAPGRGPNPLFSLARFLLELGKLEMRDFGELGRSTVAPTLIQSDQASTNVTPGQISLTCDWRSVPGEEPEEIKERLQEIADRSLEPGSSAEVIIPFFDRLTYSGHRMQVSGSHPSFLLPDREPAVEAARNLIRTLVPGTSDSEIWKFATDGGHFAQSGMKVIGFGPGEEKLAHTIKESISIEELNIAVDVNRLLAEKWADDYLGMLGEEIV